MENSGQQILLPISGETEEPWPKKMKIDRSHVNSKDETQQLLQHLYYADKKSASKSLNFPEALWNFSQNGLKLQEEKSANLNSVRQFVHFKQCMNANLQSRLLGNIPFYEKLTPESNNCSIIRDASSDFNENNPSVTKSESWAKERSKSIDSGFVLNGNELPTVNTIFYNFMIKSLIKTIESLFKNVPEFQGNENDNCHYGHESFRSEEQYHTLEPVTEGENSNGKTSHRCLLANLLKKGRMSELLSLFHENKNEDEDGKIFPCKKQTRFHANKSSQRMYAPFSRICGIKNPKLVKYTAFELLLQDKILHNSSIASKKNDTSVFSQELLFNIQQRGEPKESRTKECLLFSKNTVEYIDSVNEREQMSEQFVFANIQISNNIITPKNNIPNFTLWGKQLCSPKKKQDLTANFKLFNDLSSSKNIFEKLSIKYSGLQMVVTVGTYLQKKKIKKYSENIVFPIKKQQSHFILRASKKHRIRTFRNNISFSNKSKYFLKYLRTSGKAAINKNKYGNCEDIQENSCVFSDSGVHFSSFDTYKKVHLNTDSEEVYLISFLKMLILNDKNNGTCSKESTVADTKITYSVFDTLIYNFVSPILLEGVTSCNSSFVQEKKNKKSQYLEYIHINSQWSKCEMNFTPFPINGLNSGSKHFSDGDQYFTSTIYHYLCKDQNIAVKEWHSKTTLHGNSGKQIGFIFGNTGVLQCQPKCHSRDSKYLKQLKSKKVGDETFLFQKYVLLSSTHSSKLESMKQNVEDVNKIENEQSNTSKSQKHQNTIFPYSKDESAIYLESKDNLMVVSDTLKEHSEHTIKEYSLSECKDRYELEMKNQIDLVLEELRMFNDIDKKNGTSLLCGKTNIVQEDALEQNHLDNILGEDSRNVSENMTFSTCSTTLKYTMTVTQNKNGQSLFKDTVLKQTEKQEVLHDYCSSSISDEELFCSPSEEHGDSGCKQLPPWKPSFVCHTFMKKQRCSYQNERGNYLYDGMIRVQPLKTCCGPLRIGLSRKAKIKQLHPYLK